MMILMSSYTGFETQGGGSIGLAVASCALFIP